ncbi:MAG TPA: hypothetical protein VH540_01330 [Ktedonobacterales bacterium]|jgi:hypothetical protein
MKHALCSFIILLPLALTACGNSSLTAAPPTPTPTHVIPGHYTAKLQALNATNVSGSADFQLTGNTLVVTIHATGLQPDKEHYLHIHGAADTTVTCPTPADADASGHITIEKALTIIGPIALDLQPYPQPDEQGVVSWSQAFSLESYQMHDLLPLEHHVIVLHGMTYQGTYDRALTIACGSIQVA